MEDTPILEIEESRELIANIHKNNQIRFFIFGGFLSLSLILDWVGIGIPKLITEIVALLLLTNVMCEYLTRKVWSKQTTGQASLGYFIFQVTEVVVLLIAISYFDAVLFGGIALLMVYAIFCYLGFTRIIYPRLISLICLIGYIIVGLLEHFGFTEYHDFYESGVNLYQNRPLFIVTTSFMIGAFICFIFYGDIFLRKLRRIIDILRIRTNALMKAEGELKEAKATLEIKIEARTQALKELTESLDEQVRKKTQELHERIAELEKFHKLAVGRELKMIELKEEIERLRRELKTK